MAIDGEFTQSAVSSTNRHSAIFNTLQSINLQSAQEASARHEEPAEGARGRAERDEHEGEAEKEDERGNDDASAGDRGYVCSRRLKPARYSPTKSALCPELACVATGRQGPSRPHRRAD